MKLRKLVFFFVCSAAPLCSAFAQNFDGQGRQPLKISFPDTLLPKFTVSERADSVQKDWTVMIYLNGKNDLETAALKEMNEIESVGSTPKVNLVVELGRPSGYKPDLLDGWHGVKRYLAHKDGDPEKITSRPLAEIESADMGDWRHLVDFVRWAKTNFPARRFMLIVYDHGTGWKSQGKPLKPLPDKGISYDHSTGNHITTVELAAALRQMGQIDVYASDACLMQTAEVAYEIADYVPVIAGSEEVEWDTSYNYAGFLGMLVSNPGADPEAAGKMLVKSYADYYSADASYDVTFSAVRGRELGALAELANRFSAAVLKAGELELAKAAAKHTIRFEFPEQKDLGDFAALLAQKTRSEEVRSAANVLLNHLSGRMVISNWGMGKFKNVTGVSVYLPTSGNYLKSYGVLRWTRDSKWDELVNRLLSEK